MHCKPAVLVLALQSFGTLWFDWKGADHAAPGGPKHGHLFFVCGGRTRTGVCYSIVLLAVSGFGAHGRCRAAEEALSDAQCTGHYLKPIARALTFLKLLVVELKAFGYQSLFTFLTLSLFLLSHFPLFFSLSFSLFLSALLSSALSLSSLSLSALFCLVSVLIFALCSPFRLGSCLLLI